MRFLHLVLFDTATEPAFVRMKQLSRSLYNQWPHVLTLYYCWNAALPEGHVHFDAATGTVEFGGAAESRLPGILEKTKRMLRFVHAHFNGCAAFDWVVRSNISTLVDFVALEELLKRQPVPLHYGGTVLNTLTQLDPAHGIVDHRYRGLVYVAGCLVVWSRQALGALHGQLDDLDMSVRDDVAIGHLMGSLGFAAQRMHAAMANRDVKASDMQHTVQQLARARKVASFRFKTVGQREEDAKCMQWVVETLLTRKN